MAAKYATKPLVQIDGTPLPAELDALLERVVVDDHLLLPDLFALRFRDPDRTVLEKGGFKIGAKVKISAKPLERDVPDPLLSGEITGVDGDWDASGSHVVVRGYDLSHRLNRGRVTDVYRNVTDTDIVRKLASRANLAVSVADDSKTVHEHVTQANLSDWEFATARAREIGFELLVDEAGLVFRQPSDTSAAPGAGEYASTDPRQLTFGTELVAFSPRVTSFGQVTESKVRGWDPTTKTALVGSAPARTKSATLPWKPDEMAARFGTPVHVAVDRALATQAEVDAAAKADAERIASSAYGAEAVAVGDPKLNAGVSVTVNAVPVPFAGSWLISASRHVFDTAGYQTHLQMSGRHDRSLGALTGPVPEGPLSAGGPPVYGVVVALVTDVADPAKLGRVKVRFPRLSDTYESTWARQVFPGAGNGRGLLLLPEVGDEVLVAFEHGDVRSPFVLGGLCNGVDRIKLDDRAIDGTTGGVNRRGWISKKGSGIVFLDDDGNEGVAMFDKDKRLRISLNATQTTISVRSDGSVEIEGGTSITVTAGTSLAIKAGTTVSIEAGTSIDLSAATVSVDADGPVAVSGSPIKLN